MRNSFPKYALGFVAFCFCVLLAMPASANDKSQKPTVYQPTYHDVSIPLRDMNLQISTSRANHEMDAPRRLDLGGREPIGLPDAALQREVGPPIHGTKGLSFEGLSASNSGGYAPPDTNGSVGDTQYVEIVNVDYAVFDKTTGSMTFGPFAIHSIWTGFSGDCASGDGGDPVVLYDKAAARWVLGQLNVNYNAYCLAISTSSDATGSWARYEFQMFGGQLPDYPKVSGVAGCVLLHREYFRKRRGRSVRV